MEEEKYSNLWFSDREKRRFLVDLRSSLNPGSLTSDEVLAKKMTRISTNMSALASSATTTADISFAVNSVDYTADCITTHLECSNPNRDIFMKFVISDGESLYSWLPGGYDQLEEISKAFLPVSLGFQRYVTIKDLTERLGDAQLAPIREKKKRMSSQLSKAPTSAPRKIDAPDAVPSHIDKMKEALNVLKELTQDSPVSFFKFVINPRSFVQTAYNIFIASFLIHEKSAVLSVGDNYELFIRFSSEPQDLEDDNMDGMSNIQLIGSLSPLEWSLLVKKLNLTSPMLPEFCPKESKYFNDDQFNEDLATGVTFLQP